MNYNSILLIDDDVDDQEIFVAAVKKINAGLKCNVQSKAITALEKLESKEVKPELIFLDLNMPVMNGQQFLLEIKKRNDLKHIPVIIFTTSNHAATIALTKELGAFDFITKPEKFDTLISILTPFLS